MKCCTQILLTSTVFLMIQRIYNWQSFASKCIWAITKSCFLTDAKFYQYSGKKIEIICFKVILIWQQFYRQVWESGKQKRTWMFFIRVHLFKTVKKIFRENFFFSWLVAFSSPTILKNHKNFLFSQISSFLDQYLLMPKRRTLWK
jgi:hypothetical protein